MESDALIGLCAVDQHRAVGLMVVEIQDILWLKEECASGSFILDTPCDQDKHLKKVMDMGIKMGTIGIGIEEDTKVLINAIGMGNKSLLFNIHIAKTSNQ